MPTNDDSIVNHDGPNSDETDDATQDSYMSDHTFRWTPESTKLMLDLRFERQILFTQRQHQKKKLWSDIAELMGKQGYQNVTNEMCDLKYRNMLQTYKKNRIKDEIGLRATIVWEYYDLFKNAFNDLEDEKTIPSMICELTCDDLSPEQNRLNDIIKLENTNDEVKEQSYRLSKKFRSYSPRRSLRVSKRPRRFSRNSSQSPHNNITMNDDLDNHLSPPAIEMNHVDIPPTAMTILPQSNLKSQIEKYRKNEIRTCSSLHGSELDECKIFGESVGAQIAQVKEYKTRALLQLKIQELLYKAKIGTLDLDN